MARKIVHQLVDDLDGSVLEIGEGETVRFSIDGAAYEIDLTDAHAVALREALSPYVTAGRRVAASGSASTTRKRRSSNQDTAAVRVWAKANGHTVSERGRVPASVIAAYEAAH